MFQRVLLDFVLKTFGLGAENETRTRDPNLGKVVLYQLSYFRICCFRSRFASANIRRFFYSAKFFHKKINFSYLWLAPKILPFGKIANGFAFALDFSYLCKRPIGSSGIFMYVMIHRANTVGILLRQWQQDDGGHV